MFLTLCVISGLFLLVYFLYLQNENVGYLSFVAAFLIPTLFLPVVVPGGVAGVSSGGGPLFNLLLISFQGAFLAVALFSIRKETEPNPTKESLNTGAQSATLFFGSVLLLMQSISAFTSSPRVIPLVQFFLLLLSLIILRNMSYEKLTTATTHFFLFVAVCVLVGIFLRFSWGGFDWSGDEIPSDIYFSPLSSVLGFPARLAGPFGSPQDLGIFCSMGLALTIFSKVNSNVRVSFYSFIFIVLGTFTGSRTFYITIFAAILLKALSSLTKKYDINLLPISILGYFALYGFVTTLFLPTVSKSANINEVGGRTELWQTIFRHWSDNGLLGHGPNTLATFMHSVLRKQAYGHAHNSILQYLWDFGIPGVMAIVLFIVSWLVSMNSQKRSGLNALCIFLVFLTIQSELTFQLGLGFKGLLALIFYSAIIDIHKSNVSTQKEKITDDLAREPYEK